MTPTYQQVCQEVMGFLTAQVGKPYNETPGQNFGPAAYDCQGLAWAAYHSVGIDIGLVGSAAQYWNSKVKVGLPLRPGLQAFFYGGESFGPRPGHTGTVIAGPNHDGSYTMINAYDQQHGVIETTFLAVVNQDGLGYWGATDPISLLVPYTPPAPLEAPMLIEVTSAPSGQFTVSSWWEYGVGTTGRVLYHVADPKQVPTLKAFYGTFHSITGLRLAADVQTLGINVVFGN